MDGRDHLAFGIGANTAIFSVVDSLLLRALPVERPEELVSLEPDGRNTSWSYVAWTKVGARRQMLCADAVAFRSRDFNLAARGEADIVTGVIASGNYFDVLGITPLLGRTFGPSDDRSDGGAHGPVVVLGYAFWQQRFGGEANVIGKTLTIERVPFTIVGVMQCGFTGTDVGRTFDVAVPIARID